MNSSSLSSLSSYLDSSSSSSNSSSSVSSSSSWGHSSSSSSSMSSSSSSMSHGGIWNPSKPLALAKSAINEEGMPPTNKIAQIIKLRTTSYEIEKVYCYLIGPYGNNLNFNIHLGIYICDDYGKPTDLIEQSTINALNLNKNEWQSFDFNISETISPSNQYLAFVMWQEGGDENNYVMWGQSFNNDTDAIALFTNDDENWIIEEQIHRNMKIIYVHNMFNLTDHQVETLPAEMEFIQGDNNEGNPVFNRTIINESNNDLILDYKPLIISFILDNSGSMGWNDRASLRKEMIDEIIDKLKNNYPNSVLFDCISFGGKEMKYDFSGAYEHHEPIKLDANNPLKRTYVFYSEENNIIANKGDIYDHNSNQYVVRQSVINSNNLICDGTNKPLMTGTLLKINGSGTNSFEFSSHNYIRINDAMISYGFRELQNDSTYIHSQLMIDNNIIRPFNEHNWDVYGDNTAEITFENNGPYERDAINIKLNEVAYFRKNFFNNYIPKTYTESTVSEGQTNIPVEDINEFSIGNEINLTDGINVSFRHTIVGLNENDQTIDIEPPIKMQLNNKSTVELFQNSFLSFFDGTTLQIELKNNDNNNPVIFYIQNQNGWEMQWEIKPHSQWIYNQLNYINESANFSISVSDSEGNSLPDDTEIHLSINEDKKQQHKNELEFTSKLTVDAFENENEIQIESVEGYNIGDLITISNNKNEIQNTFISNIDEEMLKIELSDALIFDFHVNDNSKIIQNNKKHIFIANNNKTSFKIPIVDATPVEMGQSVDESLLMDYDQHILPPSSDPNDQNEKNDIYQSANSNLDYIKNGIIELPSLNGKGIMRVLPLTEDYVETAVEKERKANKYKVNIDKNVYYEQIIYDSELKLSYDIVDSQNMIASGDYILQTPVLIRNGTANGNIRTVAREFENKHISGFTMPGINGEISLLTKTYSIYPNIKVTLNEINAIQYLPPIQIDFSSPIQIWSNFEKNEQVSYFVEDIEEDNGEKIYNDYKEIKLYGDYAGNSNNIIIDYIISEKGILMNDGRISVSIYSNKKIDQEQWISNQENLVDLQNNSFINYKDNQNKSIIDIWRENIKNKNNTIWNPNPVYDKNIYQSSYGWEKADLEKQTLRLTVKNGKAQLVLPPFEQEQMIFVEAKMDIGGSKYEFVQNSLIMIRNPIMIKNIEPYMIYGAFPNTPIALSSYITWMDNKYGEIEDGTYVSYRDHQIQPNYSDTINGISQGVFWTPDSSFFETRSRIDNLDDFRKSITIIVEHSSGISKQFNRNIYINPMGFQEGISFFFKTYLTNHGWADGNNDSTIEIIPNDDYNYLDEWIGQYGLNKLISESGEIWSNNSNIRPSQQIWNDQNSTIKFNHKSFNKNIGNHPVIEENNGTSYSEPWNYQVPFFTNYYEGNILKRGVGADSLSENGDLNLTYFKFKDPLNINMYVEKQYVENDKRYAIIVADITWNGKAIIDDLITIDRINLNDPIVTFIGGVCSGNRNSTNGEHKQYKDYRGTFNCCLDVNYNHNIKIESDSSAKLSRLSVYFDELTNSSHTHICQVDSNGEGITTETITISGDEVDDHVHTINEYTVLEANDHSHSLRSVAVANIEVSSFSINPSIIGIVEFDPNNCLPYDGPKSGIGLRYPITGNRVMFSSVDLFEDNELIGLPSHPVLEIQLSTDDNQSGVDVPTYYASKDIYDIKKGFNIVANALFSEYYKIENDEIINVPSRPVEEGERILINVDAYKPHDDIDFISGYDIKRNYLILSINAKIFSEGQFAEDHKQVAIDSVLEWMPNYESNLIRPTNDSTYISELSNHINHIGGSPLYDAIRLACRRILFLEEKIEESKEYNKCLIIFSDMNENQSKYNINDFMIPFNQINNNNSQISIVKLGNLDLIDEFFCNKISHITKGFSINVSQNNYNQIFHGIFNNEKWISKYGIYKNQIQLPYHGIMTKIYMEENFDYGDVHFRYRIKRDNQLWGIWSNWINYKNSEILEESMKNYTQNIEYEFRLYGGDFFESPIVENNIFIEYLRPKESLIVFNPINLQSINFNANTDFVSSIFVSHLADITDTSEIKYLFCHGAWDNEKNLHKFMPDNQSILFTRYNEIMLTNDNKTYYAINGGWNENAQISIYKINLLSEQNSGDLVIPSIYSTDYKNGIIDFEDYQSENDLFFICIELPLDFTFACKITNYGTNNVILHNVSMTYNTMKRIPLDLSRNIINKPIAMRLI